MDRDAIPIPPLEMRTLVGPTDDAAYGVEFGSNIFDHLPDAVYQNVFDFGSGCGRNARKLLLQRTVPKSYIGIDLHQGMVLWCQRNLTAINSNFQFRHHDVFNLGLNPGGQKTSDTVTFDVASRCASLVIAWSVFTHLLESQIRPYLAELSRICQKDGVIVSTWFLFDKEDFPMMQDFQNCLYEIDPTNAVIVDRGWLLSLFDEVGLRVKKVTPPFIRGFQTVVELELRDSDVPHAPFPEDAAPRGRRPPPLMPREASQIGIQ